MKQAIWLTACAAAGDGIEHFYHTRKEYANAWCEGCFERAGGKCSKDLLDLEPVECVPKFKVPVFKQQPSAQTQATEKGDLKNVLKKLKDAKEGRRRRISQITRVEKVKKEKKRVSGSKEESELGL